MQLSDYGVMRKSIRQFRKGSASLYGDLSGKKEFYQNAATTLKTSLNAFEKYPELASLEEVRKIKEAVKAVDWGWGGGWKNDVRQAISLIEPSVTLVLTIAEMVAKEFKPTKDYTKKEAMVKTIVKCQENIVALNETVARCGFYGKVDGEFALPREMWTRFYAKHVSDLLESLSTFKSHDPSLAFEDPFVEAEENLGPYKGPYISLDYEATTQIENLLDSRGNFGNLFGIIKFDYNILDDEIEKPKEVQRLEQELATMQNELIKTQESNKILLAQLLSPPPSQEPKTARGFEKTDVERVKNFVNELLDTVVFATGVEDGKLELKVPIEQIERIYSKIRDSLKDTQYLILYTRAQNILDNLDSFRNDPANLLIITKKYVQNVTLEFNRYNLEMGSKGY